MTEITDLRQRSGFSLSKMSRHMKARNDLDYVPRMTWTSGVEATVKWYLEFLSANGNSTESFYDQYGIKQTDSPERAESRRAGNRVRYTVFGDRVDLYSRRICHTI